MVMSMKTFIIRKKFLFSILGIVFVFLVWGISSNVVNNDIILPKVEDVFVQLGVLLSRKKTYYIILNTTGRLLLTVSISLLLSIFLAILSIKSISIRNFLVVIVSIIKTLPVASIIVILLIIFGGSISTLIITAFVVFPFQYEVIYTSFKTIDRALIDDILTITNINFTVIKDVYIPIKTPYILSSIISSIGLGFKVMVMAELISQPQNTIGKEILYNKEMLEMTNVFAWTLIIVFLVMVIDLVVKRIKVIQE